MRSETRAIIGLRQLLRLDSDSRSCHFVGARTIRRVAFCHSKRVPSVRLIQQRLSRARRWLMAVAVSISIVRADTRSSSVALSSVND